MVNVFKIYRLAALLSAVLFFQISCNKKEEAKPDSNPIKIQTSYTSKAKANSITLSAEILYLNDEKVIDHGFIIKANNANKELKISLGAEVKTGLISHQATVEQAFEYNTHYICEFYLETDQKTYTGGFQNFTVMDVYLDGPNEIFATLGDTVRLKGEFNQLKSGYVLTLGDYYSQKSIPFTIGQENELEFIVPKDLGYHGDQQNLYVVKKDGPHQGGNLNNFLLTINLTGYLEMPPTTLHYYMDPIILNKVGFRDHLYYSNFKLIIGTKGFEIGDDIYPANIGILGDSYRIGYYNGRDTIFLKEKWLLEKPDIKAIQVEQRIAHPGQYVIVKGLDFHKYFGPNLTVKVGGVPTTMEGLYPGDKQGVILPDMPDGSYEVSFNSLLMDEFAAAETVEVRSLKIAGLNKKSGYSGDQIIAKGNFFSGTDYIVINDETVLYEGPSNGKGQLEFKLPFSIKEYTSDIKIGYRNKYGTDHLVSAGTILVNRLSIESFYPTTIKPGEILTIKCKGIADNYINFYIGTMEISPISVKLDEVKLIIPADIRKGAQKLSIFRYEDIIQAKENIIIE